MTLKIADPLYLLSSQTGISVNELRQDAGAGNMSPQSPQAAVKIGEPIPIVFCRRRTIDSTDQGGAFIAPKATEGYFSNQSSNTTLEYKYRLVLSQGDLTQVIVKDVYQKSCRKGTSLSQVYDGRAGDWSPDNDITVLSSGETWATPSYVGTGGSYADMTTFSFEASVSQSDNTWKNQIFVFVRGGAEVTRLADDVTGPSDNFADLAKYLLEKTERVGSSLIDTAALTTAAKFTEANGLHFNGELIQSQNLQDYLQKESFNFLLRLTRDNGKFGLRPRLPYDSSTHVIDTTAITPKFTFTEEFVVENGFEIDYVPIEDRTPVCFQVMWKQQPDDNFAVVRTTEVRYEGEAANGPFVQIDMSAYCTTSDHSAKIGAYALAVRKYVSHHLRIKVRERNYNRLITIGDIVRVRLKRETSFSTGISHHDFMYEVERIQKTMQGYLLYDLTHFPIDSQGRSKVAREVAGATGPTSQISTGEGTFDCDVNTSSDENFNDAVGTSSIAVPSIGGYELDIPQPDDINSDNYDSEVPDWDDPTFDPPPPFSPDNSRLPDVDGGTNPLRQDPLDVELPPLDLINEDPDPIVEGEISPGDTLSISNTDFRCDGQVEWFRVNKNTGRRTSISKQNQAVSGNYSLTVTTSDIGHSIQAIGRCKDPSVALGYGPPQELGETDEVPENTRVYNNFISTGSGDPDEYLSYQGPAEIGIGGRCIDCAGNTVNCDTASVARPTWIIRNYYRTFETCTSRPNDGFAYEDGVAAEFCDVSEDWAGAGLPSLVSFELFRTDSC
jgi:hypothetical protein